MQRIIKVSSLLISLLLLVSACTPQEEPPIPTLIPTNSPPTEATMGATALPITVMPEATATATITATPALPARFASDPDNQAYLRIVHASPELEQTDVYINQLNVASFLEYGQFTEPSGIVAGEYNLSLVPAEGRVEDSAYLTRSITFEGEQQLIILIGGTQEAPEIFVAPEDTTPLRQEESRVAFINMTLDGQALSLLNTDNTPLATNIAVNSASSGLVLVSQFQTLGIAKGTARLREIPLDLRERNQYVVVATGDSNNPESLQAITFNSQVNGIASLRTMGATQGDSNYEIYIGERSLGTISNSVDLGRIDIVSAIYDVNVYAAGVNREDVAPLLNAQLSANPGEVLSMILIGETNNLRLLTYRHDTSQTNPDEARMVFIHALPEAERLSLSANGQQQLTFNYGRVSEPITLNAETTTFNWREFEGNQDTDNDVENISYDLQAGREYLYIVTGLSAGNPQIYEENVGTEIQFTDSEIDPVQTLVPVPEMRVISTIESFRVSFRINDEAIADPVGFAEGSPFVRISSGELIMTVVEPVTGQLLAREEISIDAGKRYSAYVHGEAPRYTLTIIDDEEIYNSDRSQTRMRLVNLTSGSVTNFGVALGQPTNPPIEDSSLVIEPTSIPEIVITLDGSEEDGDNDRIDDPNGGGEDIAVEDSERGVASSNSRRTLPLGTTRVVSNIGSGANSASAWITNAVGLSNLYIVDNNTERIATTLYSYLIEESVQYDVVAYQLPRSSEVRAFVLVYP
jgi:hypothetical protein